VGIQLKGAAELERMREAGRINALILAAVRDAVKPGVTTAELDELARDLIDRYKVKSAFLGYAPGGKPPYPAVICVSINEEVVHGIPSKRRKLREGDIVGVDFGAVHEGWFGDNAVTVPVGKIGPDAQKLVDVTRRALERGIDMARPGNRLYDIGAAIQDEAEANGFTTVRDFVGHGIGRRMHEEPQVPNYGPGGQGVRLRAGMVLAIEPMVNMGTWQIEELDDEWTAVTADGKLSAHFEHTVAITDSGPVVLTLP
jgi:methionyl aminopeptidase